MFFHYLSFNFLAKSLHLVSLWNGGDRLRLFKADLQEEGSFDEAVDGCDGVFHVAASMQFKIMETNNIGIAIWNIFKRLPLTTELAFQ